MAKHTVDAPFNYNFQSSWQREEPQDSNLQSNPSTFCQWASVLQTLRQYKQVLCQKTLHTVPDYTSQQIPYICN